LGRKTSNNQAAAEKGDLSRLIAEVMAECGGTGEAGFTTEELAEKLNTSPNTARRRIKALMSEGKVVLGSKRKVIGIDGVPRSVCSFVWKG
jgi:response regulator of citrate/malate metabolism